MRVADKPFVVYIKPEPNETNPTILPVTKFCQTREAADRVVEEFLTKYKAMGITCVKWWHGEMTEFHKVSVEWVSAPPVIVTKNDELSPKVTSAESTIEI